MTTTDTINITNQKVTTEAGYQAVIDGINNLLQGIDPFIMGNQTFTRSDLIAMFQKRIAAAKNTRSVRMQLSRTVESEREVDSLARPLRALVKSFVLTRFGKNSTQVQAFGFTPNRRPKKSVEVKATAVVKAKATRKARSTMGKKQKKIVKGDVTGIVVTPVTAASHAGTAPVPAPGAPAAATGPTPSPAATATSVPLPKSTA